MIAGTIMVGYENEEIASASVAMPNAPIGKRAMTAAERQRRARKKLKKKKSERTRKIEAAIQQQKRHEKYIPMPPGVTYYENVVVVTPQGERSILVPKTRPLASCHDDLEDEDILALLEMLNRMAKERGLLSA